MEDKRTPVVCLIHRQTTNIIDNRSSRSL